MSLASIVGLFTAVGIPAYKYVEHLAERDARQLERDARQEEQQKATTSVLQDIKAQLEKLTEIYQKDHDAIWLKIAEQDKTLASHDTRIHHLEEHKP